MAKNRKHLTPEIHLASAAQPRHWLSRSNPAGTVSPNDLGSASPDHKRNLSRSAARPHALGTTACKSREVPVHRSCSPFSSESPQISGLHARGQKSLRAL